MNAQNTKPTVMKETKNKIRVDFERTPLAERLKAKFLNFYFISNVIVKILPVGDNLDWALQLGLDEKTAEGIKKVKAKYLETLASLEIEEIDPTGKPFDPLVAEAVYK